MNIYLEIYIPKEKINELKNTKFFKRQMRKTKKVLIEELLLENETFDISYLSKFGKESIIMLFKKKKVKKKKTVNINKLRDTTIIEPRELKNKNNTAARELRTKNFSFDGLNSNFGETGKLHLFFKYFRFKNG